MVGECRGREGGRRERGREGRKGYEGLAPPRENPVYAPAEHSEHCRYRYRLHNDLNNFFVFDCVTFQCLRIQECFN